MATRRSSWKEELPARIHHTSVFVKDLQRSLELFNGILGMEITSRLPVVKGTRISRLLDIPNFEAEMVLLRHPEQKVFLELIRQSNPAVSPGSSTCRSGFCLTLTVPDLDSVHDRLIEAGWRPISEPLSMSDPAGQSVRLFCFRIDDCMLVELIEQMF